VPIKYVQFESHFCILGKPQNHWFQAYRDYV
jgi:hypothetical protein